MICTLASDSCVTVIIAGEGGKNGVALYIEYLYMLLTLLMRPQLSSDDSEE